MDIFDVPEMDVLELYCFQNQVDNIIKKGELKESLKLLEKPNGLVSIIYF